MPTVPYLFRLDFLTKKYALHKNVLVFKIFLNETNLPLFIFSIFSCNFEIFLLCVPSRGRRRPKKIGSLLRSVTQKRNQGHVPVEKRLLKSS